MYHYTESGLQNVWLLNGYTIREFDGEDAVSITDADELHRVIGRALACKPFLTGTELRFLRKELGLSQKRLGDMLGSTEQTVSLWERKGKMPKGLDRIVRALYLEHLDGNVKIQAMIERLIELDFHDEERLVFEDTTSGWKKAA
ncbi:putative zinc finger/helix-turn-helix protein%2C YgiT family [Bordetella ansorpii]|uniref:Putative zinc finger/helix-turn-helix protein, YgiT family n=1 Tax=Bordetella ansorpii TaxID=288768 RepID=A0A157NF00_9BORD|nr:helix-turn-helix domain-containing protein [Bordetella ansorpii]SAI19620.1 putative zinc finger/helix-turn-helix protein%2C YgiT family [Bordetella ansorpii]